MYLWFEGTWYMSKKHRFQCQIREFFYLYQNKKSTYEMRRDSYMQSTTTPHSFIGFKILSIIKVSAEMELEKQTAGGQEKQGWARHSIPQKNCVLIVFVYSSATGDSQQMHHRPNHTSGAKRWGSGRPAGHWGHSTGKSRFVRQKGWHLIVYSLHISVSLAHLFITLKEVFNQSNAFHEWPSLDNGAMSEIQLTITFVRRIN